MNNESDINKIYNPKKDCHEYPNNMFNYVDSECATNELKTRLVTGPRESVFMVKYAMESFPKEVFEKASKIIRSESLYRWEKVLISASYIDNVILPAFEEKNLKNRENMIWFSTMIYPESVTHIKSSMIGTLLDDINEGYDLDDIIERFGIKMNPINYQRPKVAPTQGNIEEAEKIVSDLGLADSLKRRYARLEELPLLWKPSVEDCDTKEESEENPGIFSHLKAKDKVKESETKEEILNYPTKTMTWNKFTEEILPGTKRMEIILKRNTRYAIASFVTEEVEGSKPIFWYDREDNRNPFSSYVYKGGSLISDFSDAVDDVIDCCKSHMFGIYSGKKAFEVSGICREFLNFNNPDHLDSESSINFIVKGFRDRNNEPNSKVKIGLALFPENLIAELKPVRKTIEAFSHEGTLSGYEEASSSAIVLPKSEPGSVSIELMCYTDLGKRSICINGYE